MTAALSARSLLGAGRVRAVYIIEGGAKPSSARREAVGSPRALARAARGREPWGSARSWRPEQRGAVFGWTRGRAGGQRGERAAVLLESLREGTEKATASPAAAASCSGVREETALKAHGQRLPPAGRAGCQPVVTVSLLSFVWKVPHTLQNNNGFCLHIPVFLLSASSAKL
ncbi:protein yippee-like 1 isoform X1 [Agelaius tricolor]|uniref:protein yippee-like 1 isoform X1 n=1 Tax=Agelaius tricolor TaxID=9191 RepID=UPI0039F1D43C